MFDPALTQRFGGAPGSDENDVEVYRLVDPEAAIGRRVDSTWCSTDAHPCGFVVGPLDTTPPAAPEISGLHVVLYAAAGGGPTDCPNVETMSFELDARDDRTALEHLRFAAFFGIDQATVGAAVEPELVWEPFNRFADPNEVEVALGVGGHHERDGENFRRAGEYCFEPAAIDLAGNLGARSQPTCIDPRDTSDERVELISGCGCTSGRAGAGWVALLVLIAVRRRTGARATASP